jgi:hypothetical protein
METKNLFISGEPDMSRIKEAKASMNLDYLVIPKNYEDKGLFDRVLAWGEKPKLLCDYALVGPKTSQEGLVAALKWILDGGDDPRATTLDQWLSDIFGCDSKMVDVVDLKEYSKDQNLKKASVRFKLQESGDSSEGRRK